MLTDLKAPIAAPSGKPTLNLTGELGAQIIDLPPAGRLPDPEPLILAQPTTYRNAPQAIASNFDRAALLVPSWGNGAVPSSAAPDNVGAFRMTCTAGPVAWVDPIVNPGTRSDHLHQFFGNTDVQRDETYASLRTSGESTCNNKLNRSGYWLPAMLNGRGQVVRPDYVTVYYKRRPTGDPICTDTKHPQYQGECVDLPRGLRFIFGFDMLTGKPPTGAAHFNCQGPGATPGHYASIVAAAKFCPAGAQIGAIISAPECWDGLNLDTPNHRDHVAYAGYGDWGYLKCPATHPKVIPTFTQGAWYTTDATLDRSGDWKGTLTSWHLASDAMPGHAMMPGSTLHTDYWEGWDDATRLLWQRNCIDKLLNCSGGDLGNGQQLKFPVNNGKASPRLVPTPLP